MPGSATGAAGLDVDAVFAALADPTRRAVIGRLAQEPASASRLAAELPISRQAVAKHLAALDRAGLVAARREGRETRYTLDPAPMGEAMAWMAGVGAQWDERLARLARRAREEGRPDRVRVAPPVVRTAV
jgi:DNA-binding transcriptional ArsR family regulator